MALLEIVHAFLGLVPSSVLVTFVQVMSRIFLVWVYSNNCLQSQIHWSLYLMIGSWSTVEMPRYLFYALKSSAQKVPFWIFWLRYSLFVILYPTGITGEVFQIWNSLSCYTDTFSVVRIFSFLLLSLYVPGSPFMVGKMFSQRRKAFNKASSPRQQKFVPP